MKKVKTKKSVVKQKPKPKPKKQCTCENCERPISDDKSLRGYCDECWNAQFEKY